MTASEAEAPGFFPFPFFVGAMAMGEGGFEIGLEAETGAREEEEQGTVGQRKEERLCATTGPPSWAQNEEAWGSRATHVQSTATWRPRPRAVRARGASYLPLRFSVQPSPFAPWGRGLLPAF